jgi:uncharacterized membrane protein
MFDRSRIKEEHWIFGLVAFFALAGLVSSFVLSVDKLTLLQNPNAVLSCSINVWINCASVMQTWQSHVFGFPNSFIGLMGFPIVIAVAIAALMGAKLPRAFMAIFYGGVLLGLIFAYWLFFQSVFVIQVLCPWCLVVTVSMTIMHEALLRYCIRENTLNLPKKLHGRLLGWVEKDYDKVAVAAWMVAMVAFVLVKFPGIFSG